MTVSSAIGRRAAGRRFLFAPFLPVLEGPNLDVRTEAGQFWRNPESVLGMHTEDAASFGMDRYSMALSRVSSSGGMSSGIDAV